MSLINLDESFTETEKAIQRLINFAGVNTKKRKKSVDLEALAEATEDGRIEVWIDSNGDIWAENVRSKKVVNLGQSSRTVYGDKEE